MLHRRFSKLLEPLTTLTRKNAHFDWMDECEKGFQELKRRLVTALVLALPTESGNFMVYSNTSKKGLVGGVNLGFVSLRTLEGQF
jgi:hypothetical protein